MLYINSVLNPHHTSFKSILILSFYRHLVPLSSLFIQIFRYEIHVCFTYVPYVPPVISFNLIILVRGQLRRADHSLRGVLLHVSNSKWSSYLKNEAG